MTAPTNARQTSERERLAEWLERWATEMDMGRKPDVKDKRRIAAAQLRADERLDAEIAALRTELARLRLTHTETAANLAAADEQVHATDEIISALRAENEALRTDAARYRELRQGDLDDIAIVHGIGTSDSGISGVVCTYESELTGDELDKAIDVRSKESRRG